MGRCTLVFICTMLVILPVALAVWCKLSMPGLLLFENSLCVWRGIGGVLYFMYFKFSMPLCLSNWQPQSFWFSTLETSSKSCHFFQMSYIFRAELGSPYAPGSEAYTSCSCCQGHLTFSRIVVIIDSHYY